METIPERKFHIDQLHNIASNVGLTLNVTDDQKKAHILFQEKDEPVINLLQENLDLYGYDYIVRQNAFGTGNYVIIDVDKNDMSRKEIDAMIETIPYVIDHLGSVSQKHVDFIIPEIVEKELQRRWDLLLKRAQNINS